MYKIEPPYTDLDIGDQSSCMVLDHMGGFDSSSRCPILDILNEQAGLTVYTEYILDEQIKNVYTNLDIKFDIDFWNNINARFFYNYRIHPEIRLQNFLCTFNGTPHVGRQLLVAILGRFGWFDAEYCSKNFVCSADIIDGHLENQIGEKSKLYRKFFVSPSDNFLQSINGFGHTQYDHANNIYNLENKLSSSFLHLVSETMATSYYPFVTEKFLYSIVTRGLFLAYAQPEWHEYLNKYFGFKKYTKIFDYRFDSIKNPVERLVELMTMISKFSILSMDDWKDLYEMEIDTIEFNYDHYFSKNYLKHFKI